MAQRTLFSCSCMMSSFVDLIVRVKVGIGVPRWTLECENCVHSA